ncbi:MAG: signal peptidase I [Dehalococcoidales bacterium]|nr:signal peptidase I [Dehalococcoidales bacterium]
MKVFFREIVITLALALIIFFAVQSTVQTFVVVYSSMEPNFQEGQRLLVNKVGYFFGAPSRGDVIIFKAPGNRKGDFIKRVIGLPGDTVEVKSGGVYINGKRLSEPYIKDPPAYTLAPQKIPADNYFVLGDNRNNSDDSHAGFLVTRDSIIGKAWLSTWPPAKWGLVLNYPLKDQLTTSLAR